MKNLIEFLSDFMNVWTLIDVALILFFAFLAMVYYDLNKLARKNLKDYQFYNTVSAQTIEDYDNQIKLQENKITDLKSAFEDAVSEITKLRVRNKLLEENEDSYAAHFVRLKDENKLLESCNQDNLKSIKYWKERALHQKHTKKVVESVESNLWEYIQAAYNNSFFIIGNKYQKSKLFIGNDNLIYLICEDGSSCLVEKRHFKPVTI